MSEDDSLEEQSPGTTVPPDEKVAAIAWIAGQALSEVRQTGTVASLAFFVGSAVLATVNWLNHWRWLLIVAMVTAIFSSLHAMQTGWGMIGQQVESFEPDHDTAASKAKEPFGTTFTARLSLVSLAVSALSLMVFLIRNIW